MKQFLGALVISLVVLLSSSVADAETLKDEAAVRKFTDAFMEKVGSGDVAAAFEILRPYSILNDADFNSWEGEYKLQRQPLSMHYGPSAGYVFIDEQKKGDTVYMLLYIEKTQKQALIWAFYFYMTKDGWVLDELGWTDQLSRLFQLP